MGRMFEVRKATMFARWDRMAKMFTRLSKDITIAVKAGGPSPEYNPALRRILQNCRAANMPKDKIEAAIKRAQGNDSADYEVLVYEGYAPHGIALLVETATDNPTRTIANVRMHFNKNGGTLGNSGSVGFLFKHVGVFKIDAEGVERDELELSLIDHGLEDLEDSEGEKGEALYVAYCAFNDFGRLQTGLEELNITPVSSNLEYLPLNVLTLSEEQEQEVLKLIDRLEQDDDVQNVFHTLA